MGFVFKMDLEKWDVSCFGWHKIKGVYAVCTHDENKKLIVQYIGSSSNIGKRLESPKHPYRVLFDKGYQTFIKYYPTDNYKEFEVQMIKKYKPVLNIQHNG